MIEALFHMAGLIVCGVVWRTVQPGGISVTQTRTALTGLVYYLFLPALVLLVMWRAPLGLDAVYIALVAAIGIAVSMVAMFVLCRVCGMDRPTKGAVMLAAAFPNATYLGLPVLEATLGEIGRSIAIAYDLFACTPILLTVGIWIAARYGTAPSTAGFTLLKVPAIWAAVVAVGLNVTGVPLPQGLAHWLTLLANGVVPLMLISLGLSLVFERSHLASMRSLVPVIAVKLALMPLVVLASARWLGLEGELLHGVVLEAAMPSMVIGVVLCDRYGLNSIVYAASVTVTTALSFATLTFWHGVAT